MLIKIDFESDTPIYIQLKRQIIIGIALSTLEEGESLPSVRQLASDIGINMHTVNKAYNILKDEGYIIIDRRKGAVVSKRQVISNIKYKDKLYEDLEYIISEAYCNGLTENEFIMISKKLYKKFKGENKDE